MVDNIDKNDFYIDQKLMNKLDQKLMLMIIASMTLENCII
jgi:hypothetical protein